MIEAKESFVEIEKKISRGSDDMTSVAEITQKVTNGTASLQETLGIFNINEKGEEEADDSDEQ